MAYDSHGGWLHRLPIYSTTTEIIVAIGFFVIAYVFSAIDKNKTSQFYPRLRIFQLAITSCIIALSVLHAALLAYPSAFLYNDADPAVVCALFTVLQWVILILPLIDQESDAAFPHYGAWIIITIFEILNTLITLLPANDTYTTKFIVDGATVVLRLVFIVVLLASSAATKYFFYKREDGTPEETQPLLDVESTTNKKNKVDKDGEHTEDNDDEDDEDDEDEDETEWQEDLAGLKKRPWHEYITSFKLFLPHLRPKTKSQYFYLVIMLSCTGLTRVLNVLTPLTLGRVVNNLEGAKAIPWTALAQFLAFSFVNSSAGLSVIEGVASLKMTNSMRMEMDIFVYNHIMNLDAKFHDSKKTASLGRITDRGDAVIDLFHEFFFEFMPTVADLLISLAVLQYLFGAYLCFIVAITGVLFAWSNTHLIKTRTALRRKYMNTWCGVYEHMFETQYNWTTVSHFGRIEHEKGNFRKKNEAKMDSEMALTVYTEITRCTRQLIMTAGFIFATILATNQIVRGHRQVGDFVMLVTYWSQVMSPVRAIISTITTVSERLVDAEKLLLVLETKPVVVEKAEAPEFDFQGGTIDFENVTFSYDGERTVSEGISFHADAGQTIALVGETGGGKSTLLKLLFRFYDPMQGRILVDGQDISKVKLESFRNLMGIVPQDPAMFNRSIFENVRYPDNVASEEEVIEACKAACLHDKIMTFAKQYKEKVGERGTKLSGGECQRLAIARAILKKPKMLLLDEATSAVDSVTESKIQACLRELCKGRTTFVIAHRLSTILHADQIMVIKGGKLMEMGPHRDLIKRKGPYRELWDAQLNLQKQDPDAVEKKGDGKDETDDGAKKEGQQSMFFNDINQDEINEAMLFDLHHKSKETDGRPESSSGRKKASTSTSSTNVEGEAGSEDATEVESCNDSDDKNRDKPYMSLN